MHLEPSASGVAFSPMDCGVIPDTRKSNCLAMPACLNTALAVCRDRIFPSTGKRRCVIGLYQIHGHPFPVAQSDIDAHGESPSRAGCSWPSEGQDFTIFVLAQYMETRGPVVGDAVQLQQLGDKSP